MSDFKDAEGWIDFGTFKYKGAVSSGIPNGRGVLVYPGGIQIESRFTNGIAAGPASVIVPNYGRVEGMMGNGVLVEGHAVLNDGTEYTGQFQNWQFQGHGILFRGHERFGGVFARGQLNGEGSYVNTRTNTVVQGTFRNGLPEGPVLEQTTGGARIKHYSGGRDVTVDARHQRAAQELSNSARSEAQRWTTAAVTRQTSLDKISSELSRARDIRTQRGIDAFNKACHHCGYGYSASLFSDGTVRIQSGGYLCLLVRGANERTPTAEEEAVTERVRRQARAATMRMCAEWAKNIDDPSMPARARSLQADLDRERAQLNNVIESRRRAEAAAARYQAELRQRQYSDEVRSRAAVVAAEEQQLAATRAARLAERRRACSGDPGNTCLCALFNPAPPRRPGQGARGSCQ